jgi:hypothetical protein
MGVRSLSGSNNTSDKNAHTKIPVGFRSMYARVEARVNVIRGTLWLGSRRLAL